MQTDPTPRAAVLIPFVCPVCAGANAAHLVSLSRAGGMACVVCKGWLRATDVMRAMHAPRPASDVDAPTRLAAAARAEHDVKRDAKGRRDIEWPPTPKTRASAVPLMNRDRETQASSK